MSDDVRDVLDAVLPVVDDHGVLPPGDLRAGVLAAATDRRSPGWPAALAGRRAATETEVYRERTTALAAVLDGVADWSATAAPYAWTVHGLLGHLVAVERYFAAALGVPGYDHPTADTADHIAFTQATVDDELRRAPAETLSTWKGIVADCLAALDAGLVDLEARIEFHGFPMGAGTLLVVRGFELWTHDDDIRRAGGRPTSAPPADVVRAMSQRSVESLPALTPVTNATNAVRVVLTGDGGGVWDLRLGDPGAPVGDELVVIADAVDYCRLVARRLDPADLDADVAGDPAVLPALWDAARVLAF